MRVLKFFILLFLLQTVHAQEFPSRALRIVVPWPPSDAVREPLFASNAKRLYQFDD